MGYFDNIVVPNSTQPKKKGGYFDQIRTPNARENEIYRMEQEAQVFAEESRYANSFAGLAKETGIETGKRLLTVPVDFAKSLYEQYKTLPGKIGEDISAGAKDIEKAATARQRGLSFGEGAVSLGKGIAKATGRTAGDVVMGVYAPIGAAIGAALNATGGSELIDATGKVIADKSGITDFPAFQKFAIEHPNAGADFERILNLGFAGAEKGTIDPKRMTAESAAIAEKLVGSPTAKIEGAQAALNVRNLPVSGESTQTSVPLNTSKTRFEAYRREQGYEPYVSPDDLPTIEMGSQPKGTLPTVQIGAPSPRPSGVTYEPVSQPKGYFDSITIDGEVPAPTTARQGGIAEPVSTRAQPAARVEIDSPETVQNSRAVTLEKAATEKKLVDGLGETPTHSRMNMKEQASKAVDFAESDPAQAIKVAKGEALPPSGVLAEAVYTALEIKAIRNGDVALIRELANSKVPTIAGQSLKALDSADPNSPVRIVRDIQATRQARVEKKSGKTPQKLKTEEVKTIDSEIKATTSKRPTWEAFIDEITCGY